MRNARRFKPFLICLLVCLVVPLNKPLRAQPSAKITIGTLEALTNLDPAEAGDVFSWEVLTHLYTGLTRQKPGSLQYELALADSHTVSADGLTHTFTIRPDAAFDDGTPITAQTFVDSINRVLKLNGAGAAVIRLYLKAASVNSAGALLLTLTAPIPYLEQLVALPPYFPVSPATFAADQVNRAPSQMVSNGIYKLGSFEAGKTLTLSADPGWKGQPPATPTIILEHFAASADLREALKAHQVDLAWRGLPYDDIDNATKVKGIRLETAPSLQTFYLLFTQLSTPYNDPIARQSLAALLDRDRAVKNGLLNTALPLYTLIPPELAAGQTPTFPSFDPQQAAPILAKGDYSKYKRIESEMQGSRGLYGELYANAINEISSALSLQPAFNITHVDTDPIPFLDQIDRGTFRLAVVGLTPLVPHPDAYLRPLLESTGELALGAHYANTDVDKLLDQAALSADPAMQARLYNQVQTIALGDVVAVPLWQNKQMLTIWDSISGIQIEPNFLLRYDRLTIH